MEYLDFARKTFALAVHDADVEGVLFEILMDMDNALQMSPSVGYHNLAHAMRVASIAYFTGQNAGLTQMQCDELLIAGIFHDAGHSCSPHIEDRDNIAVACGIFNEWHIAGLDKDRVITLIKATTADEGKVERIKTASLQEQVMADADLMVWIDRQFEDVILDGLTTEGYPALPPQQFFGNHGCFTVAAQRQYALAGLKVSLY